VQSKILTKSKAGNSTCPPICVFANRQEESDQMVEELTILTVREAAEYLRVSPYTLRKMETEGSLIPFRTPGGHRRYSLRMLNKYLEESRTSSQGQESESQSQAA
jgi:excisionase family DNA binding protein